jgi:hypothetical protein
MKMALFWDIDLMMEAVSSSGISINIYPDDGGRKDL